MYAVIMAGGKGTRFWPRSRAETPKQLLNITGDKTMLQETADRIARVVSPDKILIVTNTVQRDTIMQQMPEMDPDNIIAEPVGKNTAPCICLAALCIQSRTADETMAVLPADHYIGDPSAFCETLKQAEQAALRTNGLITIGITPRGPETGYGYIQHGTEPVFDNMPLYAVKKFHEKPDEKKAREYVASDNFLWNSGMFVWRASAILDEMKTHIPHVYENVASACLTDHDTNLNERIADAYSTIDAVSVDYGVMEKSEHVFTMIGDFEWNDIGSWAALYDLLPKDGCANVITGEAVTVDTAESFIYSPKRLTAVLGVHDVIIIDTEDALLVCDKKRCQDIRAIVSALEQKKMERLL